MKPSPPPVSDCPDQLTGLEFGLGLFLLIGTLISYLPQHIKLYGKKSHVGLSLSTAVLGSLVGASMLANYIALQYFESFECCKYVDGMHCFGNLMPFLQLVTIYFCAVLIMFMYAYYFDEKWVVQTGQDPKKVWAQTKRVLYLATAFMAILFMILAIVVLSAGIFSNQTKGFGNACVGLASIFIVIHWVPQIYKTYVMKKLGALSLPMIFLQAGGAVLTAYFFSLNAGDQWYLWVPFVIASVLLFILLGLSLVYYMREKKEFEQQDYVVVNDDDGESNQFFSPKELYTEPNQKN